MLSGLQMSVHGQNCQNWQIRATAQQTIYLRNVCGRTAPTACGALARSAFDAYGWEPRLRHARALSQIWDTDSRGTLHHFTESKLRYRRNYGICPCGLLTLRARTC